MGCEGWLGAMVVLGVGAAISLVEYREAQKPSLFAEASTYRANTWYPVPGSTNGGRFMCSQSAIDANQCEMVGQAAGGGVRSSWQHNCGESVNCDDAHKP